MADNVNPTAEAESAGAPPAAPDAGLVPQDKVNKLEAKWRREAEGAAKKAADLEARLAEFETAQKSEAEKAIEKARKEASDATRRELEAVMLQKEIDAELKIRLQANGYDPDLAFLVKGKSQIGSVEDIDDAITTVLDGKEWARKAEPQQRIPAQAGTPSHSRAAMGGAWTQEKVDQFLRVNGARAITPEMWKEINRDMGTNIR